jgi:hypothetical protein
VPSGQFEDRNQPLLMLAMACFGSELAALSSGNIAIIFC